MLNALTVDVEDYFQVNAFTGWIRRASWESFPLRVYDNTLRLLDLFDRFQVKGTFFVLGWVAERLPGLVREIQGRGHEIGSHGYDHVLLFRLGREKAQKDIRRGRLLLEDIAGAAISGYRAPGYSISSRTLWAFDFLIEEGFLYDSSVVPIRHDVYGIPEAPRFPYPVQRDAGMLQEFPLTTFPIRFGDREYRLPIAGGDLRLLPALLVRRCLERINRHEHQPAVLYLHPWELDPGQPRLSVGFQPRFRHYHNLHKTEAKLTYLLTHLKFGTMSEVLGLAAKPTETAHPSGGGRAHLKLVDINGPVRDHEVTTSS